MFVTIPLHLRSSNLVCCQLIRRYAKVIAAQRGSPCQHSSQMSRITDGSVQIDHYKHYTTRNYTRSITNCKISGTCVQCCNCIYPDKLEKLGLPWKVQQHRCYTSNSTMDNKVVTPIFLQAQDFGDRTAVISQHGRYSYSDILNYSAKLVKEFTELLKDSKSKGADSNPRIAFLCENDLSYVVTQWAIFMSGCIAVPLCKQHPTSEMQYFVEDSGASVIVGTAEYAEKIRPIATELGIPLMVLGADDYSGETDDETEWLAEQRIPMLDKLHENQFKDMPAMFIYTSGTTGRPKGVVVTYGNIDAQMQGMIQAWGWSSSDVILHVLPLHHVHGIVNVLMTALFCGATCKMLPKFDPRETWKALLNQNTSSPVNVFMAVPTIYAKLIEAYDAMILEGEILPSKEEVKTILQKKIRLMVSGSAALPQPVMERWEEITGHTLLERYGMTEIGMALTNPLKGKRTPGAVGNPFPGVEVAIVKQLDDSDQQVVIATGDSQHTKVTPGNEEESGELLVRGPSVFHQYWNSPEATEDAFTKDGWFKTGDTVMYTDGSYKIVGRTSVDVIKSGGYKISALDIERHLLAHPSIRDVAVVGLPHTTWGQVVAAAMVLKDGHTLSIDELRDWAEDKMIPYHIPKIRKVLEEMPRNAMGKVNKKDLVKTVFPEYVQEDLDS